MKQREIMSEHFPTIMKTVQIKSREYFRAGLNPNKYSAVLVELCLIS